MQKFYSKFFLLFLLAHFFLVLNTQIIFAQLIKGVSITKIKKGRNVEIWAKNTNKYHVTVFFSKGEHFKNCFKIKDSIRLPERFLIPAKQKKILLFTLFPEDMENVCNAHIYWDFFYGDFTKAIYNTVFFTYPYLLPFDYEKYIGVSQGYFGNFSHRGLYALDFVMPENTRVSASRAGVVLEVKESSKVGGIDNDYLDKANFVKILHNDSTVALYAHLKYNGAVVQEGQRIQRGQHIGYSGNTGYSSGAHLHFSVYSLKNRQSVPTMFKFGKFIFYLETFERYYRFTGKKDKISK